jgi:hypothetical protein
VRHVAEILTKGVIARRFVGGLAKKAFCR